MMSGSCAMRIYRRIVGDLRQRAGQIVDAVRAGPGNLRRDGRNAKLVAEPGEPERLPRSW